jgi:hypothetical protein
MFTEQSLHMHPTLVKALMGLPAEVFWDLVQKVSARLPAQDQQRLERPKRQRATGAGRACDQPVAIRVALVLTYLRLHVPQVVVGWLYGATQADVSRDLRRVLPALQAVTPCPEVWKVLDADQTVQADERLPVEQLADGRVLVDATEQRVSRPHEHETRKAYYSGKKKQFTLKTQFVTDGAHSIQAISEAKPGALHDKKLSDAVQTLEHLPDGCEADADKGYQGLDAQVRWVMVVNAETGEHHSQPRLTVKTPFKKPRGAELTDDQKAFNAQLNAIRVRVEHCIGWAKNWAILATRFRCAHSIYTSIIKTVCGLVNLQTRRWQAARAANSA